MSHCRPSDPTLLKTATAPQRIALIGQPNTGKSTFFNRIAHANVAIANWPGLTVDLFRSVTSLGSETVECIDLPGIYHLNGLTEDEKVVQRFLETYGANLIVVVLNATQIDRQLRLLLEVQTLGLPVVALLNMADEAKRYGVQIDVAALGDRLGIPVYALSAKSGNGCRRAIAGISQALQHQPTCCIAPHLVATLETQPVTEAAVTDLLHGLVRMPALTARTFTNLLDGALLHPIAGLPLFLGLMFLAFWLIWSVGLPSADPVDALTGWFQATLLEPLVSPFPLLLQDLLLNGIWAGFAALISFIPLVALFFVVMGLLEDSGYLSRAAYLMDALMGRLGLDGRSFVLQMLGFGCNVPAILGTRVMRSRGMRLLAMLVIPFSLCSARLQVFVFILAAVLPGPQGAIALFLLYVMSFVAALGVAAVLSRFGTFQSHDPFVMELPPYRWPTLRQVALRVWRELKEFVTRLSLFMILGTSIVWVLTTFPQGSTGLDTWAGHLGQAFAPLMQPLGINPLLSISLILGFVAKEVQIGTLALIYGLNQEDLGQQLSHSLTFAQGFSYCLFSLLYIPCLTTLGTLWAESKSLSYTALAVVIPLGLAWVLSFGFYQGYMGLQFALGF